MSQDQQTYKRAVSASLVGLLVQITLSLGVLLLGLWAETPALSVSAWYFFGGLPIWIILLLVYNQHRLERMEALETEQLAATDKQAAAIFDEHGINLQLARQRLERLYKWGLNIISLLVAGYLLIGGLALMYRNYQGLYAEQPTLSLIGQRAEGGYLAILLIVVAMTAFLVARYVSGMTRVKEWQLLRGGAAYLMGNACVAMLICIAAIMMAWAGNADVLFKPLAVIVPAFMALIGLEMGLAYLLGAYRPRRPGEVPRPAFDSRLLGFLTSPESLSRIVSETINYQFGFEISRSWFYRLMGKAITPLLIFGLAVLVALSSVVVVGPHEKAVITQFGKRMPLVDSGLHFKMPWPIGRTKKYGVGRIHQVFVGSSTTPTQSDVAILWTTTHTDEDEQFLVTAPSSATDRDADAPFTENLSLGMSLVATEIVIQYRISDLEQYVTTALKPQDMLKALADRRVNAYFATHDIDTLLGRGRRVAGETLKQQIQTDADAMGLGIEVVFAGITGIHPPQVSEVAAAFHEQIGALQQKQSTIEEAQTAEIQTLSQVAGDRDKALAIRAAIDKLNELKAKQAASAEQTDSELVQQVAEQRAKVEQLVLAARGEAATRIYQARAYRWKTAINERAKAERFKSELRAYENAPAYYAARQYLNVLARGLAKPRKYIIATDNTNAKVMRFDFKDVDTAIGAIMNTEP